MVNIRELLFVLFSETNLLDEITNYMIYLSISFSFDNIIQSPFWKEKVKFFDPGNDSNQILIPIMIYFDDYKILNPLGSHSGQFKIGGVYIKILALPHHLFTEDRKKFGNEKIFEKLVANLNSLQIPGIFLNGKVIKLITYLLGGIHSILGFSESFRSHYYCRFCRVSYNEAKYLCNENTSYLRN